MENLPVLEFPLPQVASSLRPYIKTRQEALRVRRTLTIYLGSTLASSKDESKLPYALAAPDASLSVKRIPPEISGLRRQYLKALQANEKARGEYQFLSDLRAASDETNTRQTTKKVDEDDEDHEGLLHTYLALSRLRQRFEKLRIFQDYLDLLCRKAPAKSQFLDMNEILKDLPMPPKPPAEALRSTGANVSNPPVSSTDKLSRQLEMSVLRAKHLLENEQRLLAEWKNKRDGETAAEATDGSRRLQALGQVRNELIHWIESELSKTGHPLEGDVEQTSGQRTSDSDSSVPQSAEGIMRQYQEYIEARKSLLMALSMATSSLPTQEKCNTATAYAADESGQVTATDQIAPAYSFLPYFSHHLLPLSTFQKSIVQQKSCLTTGLAKQQRLMIQAIERLGEESHLLPSYPLLAGQARFRNAAAVLASRAVDNRPVSSERDITGSGGDDCIKKARAWVFASDAARAATEDSVREKFESGEVRIQNARETLAKILELLGRTIASDSVDMGSAKGGGDADIWATIAVQTSKKGMDKSLKKAQCHKIIDKDESSGLWRGLDGGLGAIGTDV
ncbi:hypothetical protein FGG08_001367 [Glutinoglossum americanum]|uniref:Uncharacterized protein n=1 Tax=Glutinoglossum americanum TaxID=1670608 RepID=A0A9P8L5C2_9PEZI|nr:hypothetical protein FGG08_001367 [Glutinoglossum americanum]